MTAAHAFRFGVLAYDARDARAWRTKAVRAETMGYATLLVDDHLFRPLAPVAALMAAADATTTLRIGSLVFGNDFRHPLHLAREAASLDLLSDGRFEFGIGTGYLRSDYDPIGVRYDSPGMRISRLEEAIRIYKGAMGQSPFSYVGSHYALHECEVTARPAQRPHPPLLVGGGGRRMLKIAAQEADIVSLNVRTTAEGDFDIASITRAATEEKVAWVRSAAGSRFAELELNLLAPFVAVTGQRQAAADDFLRAWGMAGELDAERLLESPHTYIGSVDEIVDVLHARREALGISYVVVFDEQMEAFSPVVARLSGR